MNAPPIRHSAQTDQDVRAQIKERVPIAQIMEQHGVSRTYVQVRARQMGLPYPRSPLSDHPWRHPSATKPYHTPDAT